MRKCKHESRIDDYLLDRLSREEKEKFEEHYFNCPRCFKETMEREELISFVKENGPMIFPEEHQPETVKRIPWYETIASYLTPRQWAAAAVSAALLLVLIFGIIPHLKPTSPPFFIEENTVRGESIIPVSPAGNIQTVPSSFAWNKLEKKDVEYKISLYSTELLWTAYTPENTASLPEDVKKRMKAGESYSWLVKAFSSEGALIATSAKVQFTITRTE